MRGAVRSRRGADDAGVPRRAHRRRGGRRRPCSPGTSATASSTASRVAERARHPARGGHRALGAAQQRGARRRLRRRAEGLRAGVRAWAWCAARRWSPSELADLVAQVRRDGQIRETELVMARPAAPSRHVTARVAPLGSRLVLALVEDRTRERRVEAVRRDFVANVSHELKTPVGAIRLLAEAVGDASDDPEAVERFAGRMLTESDRLSRLVQQIIELSRLQGDDPLDTPLPVVARRRHRGRGRHQSAIDAAAKSISVVTGGSGRAEGPRQRGAGHRRRGQPRRQRRALLRPGLDGARDDQGIRRRRRDLGGRPGHRHPPRRDRSDLRALLPRRPGPAPLHRRHRVSACRSSSTSPPPTAARCGSGRSRARGRRSPSPCPQHGGAPHAEDPDDPDDPADTRRPR